MKKLTVKFRFLKPLVFIAALLCGKLFLASCSPQRQLERLISRNPTLLESKKMIIEDTIILAPRQIIQNQFVLPKAGDTVQIESEAGTAIIFAVGDAYFLDVTTKASVIYNTKEINIPIIKTAIGMKLDPWLSIPITAFILLLLVIIVKYVNPQKNKNDSTFNA